jgi:hypothetical protein
MGIIGDPGGVGGRAPTSFSELSSPGAGVDCVEEESSESDGGSCCGRIVAGVAIFGCEAGGVVLAGCDTVVGAGVAG